MYRGVKRNERTRKWIATITVNSVTYPLGEFDDEEDAAFAYDAKAKELLGRHATLNFPETYENQEGILRKVDEVGTRE